MSEPKFIPFEVLCQFKGGIVDLRPLGGMLTLDLATRVIESGIEVNEIRVGQYGDGDIPQFFAALEKGRVGRLCVDLGVNLRFVGALRDYLLKDSLVSLELGLGEFCGVAGAVTEALIFCTRLTELTLVNGTVKRFPRALTKLTLRDFQFADGVDWSSLSGVRELNFTNVTCAEGVALGRALTGLETLTLRGCNFADELLAGLKFGKLLKLVVRGSNLSNSSIAVVACEVRKGPMEELHLEHNDVTEESIESNLAPAMECSESLHTIRFFGAKKAEL